MSKKQIEKANEIFKAEGLNGKTYVPQIAKVTNEAMQLFANDVIDTFKGIDYTTKESINMVTEFNAYKVAKADIEKFIKQESENNTAYINMMSWAEDKKQVAMIDKNKYFQSLKAKMINTLDSQVNFMAWAEDVKGALINGEDEQYIEVMQKVFTATNESILIELMPTFKTALSTANINGIKAEATKKWAYYLMNLILTKVEGAKSFPKDKALLKVANMRKVSNSYTVISESDWRKFDGQTEDNPFTVDYILKLEGVNFQSEDNGKRVEKARKNSNKLLIKPTSLQQAQDYYNTLKEVQSKKAKARKAEQKKADDKTSAEHAKQQANEIPSVCKQ